MENSERKSKVQDPNLAKNGFRSIIFEQKDEKREKVKLMPLMFANYDRRLNIGKVAFFEGYLESLPGLLNINRLSLSHLELSQSRFKVAK